MERKEQPFKTMGIDIFGYNTWICILLFLSILRSLFAFLFRQFEIAFWLAIYAFGWKASERSRVCVCGHFFLVYVAVSKVFLSFVPFLISIISVFPYNFCFILVSLFDSFFLFLMCVCVLFVALLRLSLFYSIHFIDAHISLHSRCIVCTEPTLLRR